MKAITTKYHASTNTLGSRITASDSDGNKVTVGYNHASSDPKTEAVVMLCRKMGWTGKLVAGYIGKGQNVYVFLPEDMSPGSYGIVDLSLTDEQIAEKGRV